MKENAEISIIADEILRIENLNISYGQNDNEADPAIRNVNLSVRRGEVVGLVGESGSGKTTLARAVMGMLQDPGFLDSGSVIFEGRKLNHLEEAALETIRSKELAMVVPNPHGELNPLLPIGQQLTQVAIEHLGQSRREARATALKFLKTVSIPDRERHMRVYPHQLSGGMAQRVAIAMALICSPKFVVLDDATSGLDTEVQTQILGLLCTLAQEHQMSMLYGTQDIGLAARYCDRIAVLYQGEIVESADTESLLSDPKHPYTNVLMAAFAQARGLRRPLAVEETRHRKILATGCPFAPNCVSAEDICNGHHPSLEPISSGHLVRCHVAARSKEEIQS